MPASHDLGNDFRCSLLSHRWDLLQRETVVLMNRLDGWHKDQLAWKPAENEWSAIQVLDHLVRTELAILARSRKLLAEGRRSPTLQQRLRFALFDRAFRLPIRVKVPGAVASLQPSSDYYLEELSIRWEKQRADLKDFLRSQDSIAARCIAMRHPVVGELSLADAVTFMHTHIRHHVHQLRRISARLVKTA